MATSFLTVCAFLVFPIAAFAWYLAFHPDWMPETPNFKNGGRGWAVALIFWAFFVLFMKLPIWIRVSFLLWSAVKFFRFFLRPFLRAFDNKPDFILSTSGVGWWDRTTFRFFPWSEISRVNIATHQVEIWGINIGSPQQIIEFEGPEVGPRRFFETLPPRRSRMAIVESFFQIKNKDVIDMIGRHRPDLLKDYNTKLIVQ